MIQCRAVPILRIGSGNYSYFGAFFPSFGVCLDERLAEI
jgi:hypothetical protein